MNRFWTQFEAYLSMRSVSAEGLVDSSDALSGRATIRLLHGTPAACKTALVQEWAFKTPEQARVVLAGPDVQVSFDRFLVLRGTRATLSTCCIPDVSGDEREGQGATAAEVTEVE